MEDTALRGLPYSIVDDERHPYRTAKILAENSDAFRFERA
jgi:hypothetical protein